MSKGSIRLDKSFVDSIAESSEVETILRKAADAGADAARRRVPVDTGELRASIYSTTANGRAEFGATAPHSKDVEFGTYKEKAHPFLRPSIDDAMRAV